MVEKYGKEKESVYRKRCLLDKENFKLAPGAIEFLNYLKSENIPMTIATMSEWDNVEFYIKEFNLEKWFDLDKIVYSDGTIPGTNDWVSDLNTKLFGVDFPGLDGVEPLFTPDDYRIYDKYGDGDPFEAEEYIRQFRVILEAIHRGTQIKFEMLNRRGNTMFVRCRPVRLEYSEKDDKFRLITAGWRAVSAVNLAKITFCEHYTGKRQAFGGEKATVYDTVTVKICDERNALERFMLHFAHFEKQAEKLDKKHYLVKIKYAHDDESEMVIRILSFGPMAEVVGSESFKTLIIEKLKKQLNCGLK
jgi:hypothetical protein